MASSLQTVDYVVFAAMFAFTMAIGVYYAVKSRKSTSKEDYFVGNRNMHFIPVALSLVVTFESSILMLGLPTEVYVYGTVVVVVMIGSLVGNLMCAVTAVPLYRPMNCTTAFEYLEQRFNSRKVRVCGVILSIVLMLMYVGIVLYALAVALEAVMGLNMWVSILIMDACAIFYTSLGGIKSVVWTDVFQSVIMFGGIFAIIIKGTMETGGTYRVWELAREGRRLEMLDFDPDPTIRHSVWCAFLPSVITKCRFWFSQPTVQRISAAKSSQEAKYMIYIASVGYLLISLLVIYEGVVVYAFFAHKGIEPITCELIDNPNQIVPYAVLLLFQDLPGMAGLFLAALYSASLSTVSSVLNSLSVLVTEDLFEPCLRNASEGRATLVAKLSVVALGVATLLFCFLVSFIEGPFSQIVNSVLAAASGPLFGIFLMACFFPSTNAKGVYVGVVVGFVISCVFTMGGNFRDDVKVTPFLPLGINGTCPTSPIGFNTDPMWSNVTDVFHLNSTATTTISPTITTTSPLSFITNTDTAPTQNSNDYNALFSISYVLFNPIGMAATVLAGILASYVFGRNKPGEVNPKYLLAISDSILVFLPPFVRRWLRGLGPQFVAGWKEADNRKEAEMEHLATC